MAECFHCGAGNPVGVCHRCNVLVCPTDGSRPGQFKCVSCGSAQAASSAVRRSGQSHLNPLSESIAAAGAEDETDVAWRQLLAGGLRLRREPGDREGVGGREIEALMQDFRSRIQAGIGVHEDFRSSMLDDRLPRFALDAAGAESGADAVVQSRELWSHLDDDSRNTLTLALLMHLRARPDAWPPALGVLLYGLDPDPAFLPRPWD